MAHGAAGEGEREAGLVVLGAVLLDDRMEAEPDVESSGATAAHGGDGEDEGDAGLVVK